MTPRTHTVERASHLDASTDEVWAQATDFAGINAELMPLLRMTAPAGWSKLGPEDVRPGQRLFRSWLLLFGVLPIDFDDLTIVELEPGHRFLERSRMLSASMWEHERRIEDTGEGTCLVSDRVRFTPRWRALGVLLRWFVPVIFTHRHRRLRRRFGQVTPNPRSAGST